MAGESGSGKSMTALAILGLARSVGASVRGSITLEGEELVGAPEGRLRALRGRRIAMIMQSPAGVAEPDDAAGALLRAHPEAARRGRTARRACTTRWPTSASTRGVLRRYPHQVSGGQAQRFAIALAVALRAGVLLADEPTSALDVTVQAQVVDLLRRLRDEHGTAMLFISHDLAVVGQLADRVLVMRDGDVVEQGEAQRVLHAPAADVHAGAAGRRAGDREGARGVTCCAALGPPCGSTTCTPCATSHWRSRRGRSASG